MPTSSATKVIDIYCRISRDNDGTLRSVEAQEAACRAAVAEQAHQGWTVGSVHRDHALSAWNPKVRRPEFEELMTRLRSGEADGVMIRNLDRFTRKMSEGELLLDVAKAGRIVVALDGSYDLTTARGQKNFYEDLIDAQYESHRLSERTVRGKRDKARRGKSNASSRGYGRPGFLPNPERWEQGDPRVPVPAAQLAAEQEVVREMATRVLARESLDRLVRDLNARGITTVTGTQWNSSAIRQFLKSPSLAGLVEHNGEVIEDRRLDGPVALDVETWESVQSVFAARKRGRPADTYLLSGIAICGRDGCGARLYGRPRTSGKPYADGEVRREYWCQKRAGAATGCGRLNIDQRYADEVVEAAVVRRLGNPRHAGRLARRAAEAEAARSKITSNIAALEADAKSLASKTATWGLARVEAAMEPIDARLAALREQLDNLDAPEDAATATLASATDWNAAKASGDITALRSMVGKAFPRGIGILPATSRGRAARTSDRFDWDR